MFISHAQNFEDVILMRAFRRVDKGFYIDVGAQDPVADSVSLAFYDKGWRGIHVEPNPHFAAKLRAARPDEEIIEAVVGTGSGSAAFYTVGETGLSTGRSDIANAYDQSEVHEINVPIISLAQILNRVKTDVHWLKIDVEGMEASVLESWSGSEVRPWVVVIESTLPNTQRPAHDTWEGLLLARDYSPVYFDGVNKFYVHEERAKLRSVFGPGPNCFDDFKLDPSSGYVDQRRLADLQRETQSARVAAEDRVAELTAAHGEATKAHGDALTRLATAQQEWRAERLSLVAEMEEIRIGRAAAEARISELLAIHTEAASAHARALMKLEAAQRDWHTQHLALVAELDQVRSEALKLTLGQQDWGTQRLALVAQLDEALGARMAAENRLKELADAQSETARTEALKLVNAQQEWEAQRLALVAELDEAQNARTTAENRLSAVLAQVEEAKEAGNSAVQAITDSYERRLYDLWTQSVELRNQLSALNDSLSWKISRPIRIASIVVRRGVSFASAPSVRRTLITIAAENPRLRRITGRVLRRLPILDRFARRLMKRARSDVLAVGDLASAPKKRLGGGPSFVQQDPPIISPRAQMILRYFESEYTKEDGQDKCA